MSDAKLEEIKQFFSHMLDLPKGQYMSPWLQGKISDLVEHPEKVLTEEDSFHFDNSICVEKCDGRCCINPVNVVINPFDFERMYDSKRFRALHGELARAEFFQKYFHLILSRNSKIPMATLKEVNLAEGVRACPFLIMNAHIAFKGGNISLKSGGLCSLDRYEKPINCMLYPLGRVISEEYSTGKETAYYFHSEHCPVSETSKLVNIKDFVAPWEDRHSETKDYTRKVLAAIKTLGSISDEVKENYLYAFGVLLFQEDKIPLGQKLADAEKFFEIFKTIGEKHFGKQFK